MLFASVTCLEIINASDARWDYLYDNKRYGDAKHMGGLRNKMGRSFLRNHKICRMSRVVAYFTVRKLCARPNAHCVLRIYARNVATALVEFKSTSWTGATSVYSRNCESFIKYSCFCRTSCCKYSSSPLGLCIKRREILQSRDFVAQIWHFADYFAK